MNKLFYTFFLAVATVKEVSSIFGKHNDILDIVYLITFVYIVVRYISGSLPEWVWKNGLSYVGISSLLVIGLFFVGFSFGVLSLIDSIFRLSVWCRSLKFMIESKD